FRADFFRAPQRGVSVRPAAADPRAAPRRRLDAGPARPAAQGRLRRLVHPARPLRRRLQLGPGVKKKNTCPGRSAARSVALQTRDLDIPLTRLAPSVLATLSHEGRG